MRKIVRDAPATPHGGMWGGYTAEQAQQQQQPVLYPQQQYHSGTTDPEGFGVIGAVGPATAPASVSGLWGRPGHTVEPFLGGGPLLSGHWNGAPQMAAQQAPPAGASVGSTVASSTMEVSTVTDLAPLSLLDGDDGGDDLWAMDVDSPSAADIMRALDCSPRTSKALGEVGSGLMRGGGALRSSRLGLKAALGPNSNVLQDTACAADGAPAPLEPASSGGGGIGLWPAAAALAGRSDGGNEASGRRLTFSAFVS